MGKNHVNPLFFHLFTPLINILLFCCNGRSHLSLNQGKRHLTYVKILENHLLRLKPCQTPYYLVPNLHTQVLRKVFSLTVAQYVFECDVYSLKW